MTGTTIKSEEHGDVDNRAKSYADIVRGKIVNEHTKEKVELIQLE